ncbi:ATP-dependent Clp protease proteolytic subunit [bacterium AB1]|nr:ATP-dependent Clp protease proteolytic subunit [bacterium AB1]
MIYIPNVAYRDGGKKTVLDIYSRLLNMGIIFIDGPIAINSCSLFLASILHIRNDLMLDKVTVYINSPGGMVYSGLAIVNIMESSDIKIETYSVGMSMSAASIILAAGTPGLRRSLYRSRIMIHQPIGGTQGQSTDICIYANEIDYLKKHIADLYAKFSNKKSSAFFLEAMERDKYLSAQDAQDFGIIDEIVSK